MNQDWNCLPENRSYDSLPPPPPPHTHNTCSFPVVDWFCLFIYLWVLTFPLQDCSEFGNFVITLIYQHIKRAAYQAVCIWGQWTTICQMETKSPAYWGWKKQDDMWQMFWTVLPPIAQSCRQLTKCGCKTECSGRCKCYRFSLPCIALCSCNCDG